MTERSAEEPRDIAEVSSAQRYDLAPHDVREEDFEVPDRHAEAIATALEITLTQMGVDPESVVFSGYAQDDEGRSKITEVQEIAQAELQKLAREANNRDARGDFDTRPELRDQYKAEIEAQKAMLKDPVPAYYFTDLSGLRDPRSLTNPINYAGIEGEASIGVYDKARLRALIAPNENKTADDMWIVHAQPEEIEEAKIAVFHPRYKKDDDLPPSIDH